MDLDAAHRQTANTADLVQILADRVHLIDEAVGAGHAGFADRGAAGDELAAQARTATDTIDRCLTLGSRDPHPGPCGTMAIAPYDLAVKWIALLEKILDAAVAIYGRACSELADRVSILEEHAGALPHDGAQRLSAALLGQHTRALAESTARRHVI
jgi:hypothetical protein